MLASAVGFTSREAEMLAARNALEGVKDRLTPDERQQLAKYDPVVSAIQRPVEWKEATRIVCLSLFLCLFRNTFTKELITDEASPSDVASLYLRGIQWAGEYYAGKCLDYT